MAASWKFVARTLRTSAGTRRLTVPASRNGTGAWNARPSVLASNVARMVVAVPVVSARVDMSATISAPACANRIVKENPAATIAAGVRVVPVRQVMPVTGRATASVCRNARIRSVATTAVAEPAVSAPWALSVMARACAKSNQTSVAMDSASSKSARPVIHVLRIVAPALSVAMVSAIRILVKIASLVPGTAVPVAGVIVARLTIHRAVMTRMS